MSVSTQIAHDEKRFDVRNIQQAKSIILTPEDSTTEHRWVTETPYLTELIVHHFNPQPRHRVLDLGCGIGRIAKSLIRKTGCAVIGVDTSVGMRSLAPAYVLDKRFFSCAPEMLSSTMPADFAIAVWSLQHIPDLQGAIDMVHKHLMSFGRLFVVNQQARCLPASDGRWYDDKLDTREMLGARFNEIAFGALDPDRTTPRTSQVAFWGIYDRRS